MAKGLVTEARTCCSPWISVDGRATRAFPRPVMRLPTLLTKGKKALFFQKNRCQGCELCVVACPTGVLELSDEYNMRSARVPRVKAGKERSCILCQRCEFACPNWALYVIDEKNADEMSPKPTTKGSAKVGQTA